MHPVIHNVEFIYLLGYLNLERMLSNLFGANISNKLQIKLVVAVLYVDAPNLCTN